MSFRRLQHLKGKLREKIFALDDRINPDYESDMYYRFSSSHLGARDSGKTIRQRKCFAAASSVALGHDELLREMDKAGVLRCVLVPPTWEADRNDTSLEAARLYPDRFRVMGQLACKSLKAARSMATLEKSAAICLESGWRLTAGKTRNGWKTARPIGSGTPPEHYDVPVMAFAPAAVPKLGEVAERHPGCA